MNVFDVGGSMSGIGSGTVMEGVSRTKAFSMIKKLGFPRPAPWSLRWYFRIAIDETFVPIVDFEKLACEINETDIISEVARVTSLAEGSKDKLDVFNRAEAMILKHRIK